jgi:hypothetical protein
MSSINTKTKEVDNTQWKFDRLDPLEKDLNIKKKVVFEMQQPHKVDMIYRFFSIFYFY